MPLDFWRDSGGREMMCCSNGSKAQKIGNYYYNICCSPGSENDPCADGWDGLMGYGSFAAIQKNEVQRCDRPTPRFRTGFVTKKVNGVQRNMCCCYGCEEDPCSDDWEQKIGYKDIAAVDKNKQMFCSDTNSDTGLTYAMKKIDGKDKKMCCNNNPTGDGETDPCRDYWVGDYCEDPNGNADPNPCQGGNACAHWSIADVGKTSGYGRRCCNSKKKAWQYEGILVSGVQTSWEFCEGLPNGTHCKHRRQCLSGDCYNGKCVP